MIQILMDLIAKAERRIKLDSVINCEFDNRNGCTFYYFDIWYPGEASKIVLDVFEECGYFLGCILHIWVILFQYTLVYGYIYVTILDSQAHTAAPIYLGLNIDIGEDMPQPLISQLLVIKMLISILINLIS